MKHTGFAVALCSLATLLAVAFIPGEGLAEAKRIDLSAALKYIEGWARRDAFPESTPFAYYNTYSLLALSGKVSQGERGRVVDFIRRCQNSDGGFVSEPGQKEAPNVIFTCFALKTLDLLDSLDQIDSRKAAEFISTLIQKNGGIKAKAHDRHPSLGTTYFGVQALCLLKALDRLDKKRTVAFINSYRDGRGGYGMMTGKPSVPQGTYMAVKALELIGGLTDEVRSGVIQYLEETRYSGLTNGGEHRVAPCIQDMACVLKTASVLSSLNKLNQNRIYDFIESLYIPKNGGFGPGPGLGATPPSTYQSVLCLVKLGKLPDPYSM